MPDFKKLFMQSASNLVVEDTYISNDLYRVQTNVNMKPAASSPFMASGTALTKIYGLDDVVAKIQQDAQTNPALQSAMQVLPMLQMFGQQKDENGKKVFVYDFKLENDGKMLLNGNDMSAMMGGGMPPQ
jgi:hypothetical protein